MCSNELSDYSINSIKMIPEYIYITTVFIFSLQWATLLLATKQKTIIMRNTPSVLFFLTISTKKR